ncbi:hypothetical protein GCM10007159_40930 [Modicisalibacter luteus]|nr:hypothetical protein GCM10007159_40930 [Halomonas lutea]
MFSQSRRAGQDARAAVPESFTQIKLTITDVAAGHVRLAASSLALLAGAWRMVNDSDAIAGLSSGPLPGWGE